MAPVREPGWWYGADDAWPARLLNPAARLYSYAAERRFHNPATVSAARPVICVGNMTAGGTGKTPTALSLAGLIKDAGFEPWFLSRGYGGKSRGPVHVDTATMSAADIGDEPRLLANAAPTVVARDRAAGAALIAASAPANAVIIMDDGLQNPALKKNIAFAVIDAARGFGNGLVIPAGPLRGELAFQFSLCDAVIVNGLAGGNIDSGVETALAFYAAGDGKTVFRATTEITNERNEFKGRRVIAYAGIANPNRFFAALESLGAKIVARKSFNDHATITAKQAQELLDAARTLDCVLVTTAKDHTRLAFSGSVQAQLMEKSQILKIAVTFNGSDRQNLMRLLHDRLQPSEPPRNSK